LKAKGPKTNAAKAKRSRAKATVTDWNKLRRRSDAAIRKGIASDPDARGTDAAFWKDATIVVP
jgi:hypothetical protein